MFKYTAHPDILHKYDSVRKNSKRPWDDHFFLAVSICGTSSAYFQVGDFWKHYKSMTFFSPTALKQVPVNGTLISVDYFTQTVV
jgi:hypothetical protein